MSNIVNGLPLQPEQLGITRPSPFVTQSVAGDGSFGATPIKSPTIPLKSESLELTDSAKALQKVQNEGSSTMPVNTAHVERIRQAIADGRYEINAERVLEKFLMFERAIGKDKNV